MWTRGNAVLLVSLTSRTLKSFSQATPPMLRSQGNLEKSINQWDQHDTSRVTTCRIQASQGYFGSRVTSLEADSLAFRGFGFSSSEIVLASRLLLVLDSFLGAS